jgi:hypothetical protein
VHDLEGIPLIYFLARQRIGFLAPARLGAGLPAAPVYTNKQANVTSVMPIPKTTQNALPFHWPKKHRDAGGNGVFPTSIGTLRCFSGYTGDKSLLGTLHEKR